MPHENSKETGYIKLWRDLTYSKLWNNINCEHFKIAIEILELAKFKRETIELLNGEKITLEPGQLITTKKYLSDRSGETSKRKVSEKAVRGALTSLKKIDFLDYTTIKSIPRFWVENEKKWADVNEKMGRPKQKNGQTKKQKRATVCTLITVVNWEFWQGELKNGQTKTEEWADVNEKMGRPKNENGQQYKNDIFKEYNNMSDSKESDAPSGAFKSDNNLNKTTKSSKTKRVTKVFEENSIEYQLSKKLYQYVLEVKPKTRKPDFQKWSKDFDLILRRDERSLEDLENVIDWIFNGDSDSSNFWKKNISSPGALRGTTKNGADKFADIYSQMENDTNYYRPLQKELEKELPPITAEEFYDI